MTKIGYFLKDRGMDFKTSILLSSLIMAVFSLGCASKPETPKTKGGPQPSVTAAGSKPLDPCSLLRSKEAAEILGEPTGPPRPLNPANPLGIRQCHWSPASEQGMGLIQIGVIQTEGITDSLQNSGYTAERLFRDSKAQFGGETIPGLGEDAFYNGSDLMILKDGIQISVSAGSSYIVQRGEQGLPAAKRAAEKAMAKLNFPIETKPIQKED
jgi:hypothetical protein